MALRFIGKDPDSPGDRPITRQSVPGQSTPANVRKLSVIQRAESVKSTTTRARLSPFGHGRLLISSVNARSFSASSGTESEMSVTSSLR